MTAFQFESSTVAARRIGAAPARTPVASIVGGYVTIHNGQIVAYAASSAACAREARTALPEHQCEPPIAATVAVISALILDEPEESFHVKDGICRTFRERRQVLFGPEE